MKNIKPGFRLMRFLRNFPDVLLLLTSGAVQRSRDISHTGKGDMDITIEFEIPGVIERDEPIKRAKVYIDNIIGEDYYG